MHRLVLFACVVAGCAATPTITTSTAATLAITPDTATSRMVIRPTLSAYLQPDGDGWQLVLADAPPGTDCRTVGPGPGSLTFFMPTVPPLVGPADGSIAQPIDVATTAGFVPHAGLDLAVATRETVGGLYFFQTARGFSGRFDATTTGAEGLMHVTGAFDAPICD